VREAEAGENSVIRSSKPRAPATSVAPAAIADVVAGNTEFAFDLYGEFRKAGGNFAFSPFSLSMAMAMVLAGTAGQTETDIARALHFTRSQSEIHGAFNALDARLEGAARGFALHIANSIWANPGSAPQAPFLDTLGLYYGAGLRLVDLTNGAVAAPAINGWVSAETNGKITNIVSPPDFKSNTRLALANAIYFSGKWTAPFDASRTHTTDFHRLDDSLSPVPTMAASIWTGYAKGSDFEAAEFPYEGLLSQASMLVIMPASGGLDAFEQSLDDAKLGAIVAALTTHVVDTELPRFDVRSAPDVRAAFEALGLGRLFVDVGGDFAPMLRPAPNYVQQILHRATVGVDEEGTEASAATVVVFGADGGVSIEPPKVPPPAVFHVDRPFLFVIRDRTTGSVLFVGRVVDPAAPS
jgi:serpin B